MIAPSQIIALTSTWCCVRQLTSNEFIKRKGVELVLLRAQLMHQPPIDQGLCSIKVSAKLVIGHSEYHAGIIRCLLSVTLIHTIMI